MQLGSRFGKSSARRSKGSDRAAGGDDADYIGSGMARAGNSDFDEGLVSAPWLAEFIPAPVADRRSGSIWWCRRLVATTHDILLGKDIVKRNAGFEIGQ